MNVSDLYMNVSDLYMNVSDSYMNVSELYMNDHHMNAMFPAVDTPDKRATVVRCLEAMSKHCKVASAAINRCHVLYGSKYRNSKRIYDHLQMVVMDRLLGGIYLSAETPLAMLAQRTMFEAAVKMFTPHIQIDFPEWQSDPEHRCLRCEDFTKYIPKPGPSEFREVINLLQLIQCDIRDIDKCDDSQYSPEDPESVRYMGRMLELRGSLLLLRDYEYWDPEVLTDASGNAMKSSDIYDLFTDINW